MQVLLAINALEFDVFCKLKYRSKLKRPGSLIKFKTITYFP